MSFWLMIDFWWEMRARGGQRLIGAVRAVAIVIVQIPSLRSQPTRLLPSQPTG